MAELDYCVPLGIPHSVFLSWPDTDQDKVMAYLIAKQEDRAARCQDCGTVIRDWLDQDGKVLEEPPFVAETKYCHGCMIVTQEREMIRELSSDRVGQVKVYLVPNPDRDRRPLDEEDEAEDEWTPLA